MTHRLISSDVMWCCCSCTLFSIIEISCYEGNSHCSSIIAGYLDSRCLLTAAFVKETDSLFDSFSGVTCNLNNFKVLCCQLSSMSKHLEHWQNATSKIKS